MTDIKALKTAKTLAITNIIALVAAVLSLVWNAAVLTTEFNIVKAEQARQEAVQTGLMIQQEKLETRMNNDDRFRTLLDGRILRLEDLGLSRGR